MIYEDFRSHVIIDAAQFFMRCFNEEIKAKELQLKQLEDEKGEISKQELNKRKSLDEKLRTKDTENEHLKASVEDQNAIIEELRKASERDQAALREQFSSEKKSLVEELDQLKSERLQQKNGGVKAHFSAYIHADRAMYEWTDGWDRRADES